MAAFVDHQDGIIELTGGDMVINDATELLETLFGNGATTLIARRENFPPAFFELSSGLAGEMLQKLSTYRCRLAVTGDFSDIPGRAFGDFVRESNRGGQVLFVPSAAEALAVFQPGRKKS